MAGFCKKLDAFLERMAIWYVTGQRNMQVRGTCPIPDSGKKKPGKKK